MPEVIRLLIKAGPTWMEDVQSASTVVQGLLYSPNWEDGQERQLDSEIYWALREYEVTTFRIHIGHEFDHDTGATGLEAWEVLLHIGEGLAAGVILQQVLPRLIKIFKPGTPRTAEEAAALPIQELTLAQARETAVVHLKSSIGIPAAEDAPLRETLSATTEDGHYLFRFEANNDSHTVLMAKDGAFVLMMRQQLSDVEEG